MGQKYSKAICERDHTGEVPQHVLDALPENQGHPVRHRCAACAYESGMNEAAEDIKNLVAQVRQLTQENERLKRDASLQVSNEHNDRFSRDESGQNLAVEEADDAGERDETAPKWG
jgi:outer membrane murein-binding lipoprotein Lpp